MDVSIAKRIEGVEMKASETKWNTQAGPFKTQGSGDVPSLKLPQFSSHRTFSSVFHMFEKKLGSRYDMILGRDILQKIGLNVLNSNKQFEWSGILVDMITGTISNGRGVQILEHPG